MKDLVIVGAGGHCRSVLSAIHGSTKYRVHGVLDLKKAKKSEIILGVPVIGDLSLVFTDSRSFKNLYLHVAIGDNKKRMEVAQQLYQLEYLFQTIIHPSAVVCSSSVIGPGSFISGQAYVGPLVEIGSHSIVNTSSVIEHECEIGDYVHAAPNSTVCGRSRVGSLSFLGASSTVIQSTIIHEQTLVAAGSVVVRNTTSSGLKLKGIPAKQF